MDEGLRAELLRMQADDLAVRRELIERGELFDGYHPEMAAVHRRHNARMRVVLDQVGWPGIGMVGEDGCEAAWQIVQHGILDAEMQHTALGLLREAVDRGDAPAWQMAMLTDRVLMEAGEPQEYGSILVSSEDGLIPWTMREADGIEARRASVGLPPLHEHLARLRHKANFEARIQKAAHVVVDGERLKGCVGEYRTADGVEIRVWLDGDRLVGRMGDQPEVVLIAEDEGHFLVREVYGVVTFEAGEDGRIRGMVIEMADGVMRAEKVG